MTLSLLRIGLGLLAVWVAALIIISTITGSDPGAWLLLPLLLAIPLWIAALFIKYRKPK
ncbi:hypothetical protein [Salsuginibacillus kocurii]|uniref:hypothetical protein n=1 Tax=Salsuginibacillus kocurii TaxID=427078 RepID=UPI0003701DA6|nr:hypothetical protein [Salsuginibacillus kocurii]